MKKVLILAYDLPPFVSVGGLRPYNWFKYMKDCGYEPIVVTRQWDEEYNGIADYVTPSSTSKTVFEENGFGTIIKSPYFPNFPNRLYLKYGEHKFKLIRKVCSAFFEISQFLWITGPKKEIYKSANQYLKNNRVDIILATGDPFVLFHYASLLSQQYKTPWIADYRDPWSFGLGMDKKIIYKRWSRFIEKKTLKTVSEITTVSNTFLNKIQLLTDKKIHVIPNGYDPEIIDNLELQNRTNKILTIGFIGSMYKWNPVKQFLKILSTFVSQNGDDSIRLNMYGINNKKNVQKLIETKYTNLQKVVTIYPRLPNDEVLAESSKSHVLLLFNYYAIIGTKIYDYMGMKIPILFCFSNDEITDNLRDKYKAMNDYSDQPFDAQQKLIEEKNAGIIVENSIHLIKTLESLSSEFKENGEIKCHSLDNQEFSRKRQTEKLSQIMNALTN